jgi:phage-related protein
MLPNTQKNLCAGSGLPKKDLLALPPQVVGDSGYALGAVQMDAPPPQAKLCNGDGSAVWELLESRRGDTFRAVYTVRFVKAVCALHCSEKKSPSRIRTAQSDINLIYERVKLAELLYKDRNDFQS